MLPSDTVYYCISTFTNSQVKQVQVEREMKLAGNRSLAEYNMSQGTKLTECKSRLAQLYEQLNEQTKLFDENKQTLGGLEMIMIYTARNMQVAASLLS